MTDKESKKDSTKIIMPEDKRKYGTSSDILADSNRLKVILEREQALRRERALILRERLWFTKPSNWIGIIAIIVSIIISLLSIFAAKEKKELTITHTPFSSVFTIDDSKHPLKIQILADGQPIRFLGKFIIRLQNTGTKAITSDDFKDGPLEILVRPVETLISKNSSGTIPYIVDAVPMSSAGQTKHIVTINKSSPPGKIAYLPSIMNSGDVVEIEIYISYSGKMNVKASGKIIDGQVKDLGLFEPEELAKTGYSPMDMMFGGFSKLFGSKIIAVAVSLILAIIVIILWIVLINGGISLLDAEDTYIYGTLALLSVLTLLFSVGTVIYG